MQVMSKQLAHIDIAGNTQSAALWNHGPEISWNDWIFEESKRRFYFPLHRHEMSMKILTN
jgi:hypothetical protein